MPAIGEKGARVSGSLPLDMRLASPKVDTERKGGFDKAGVEDATTAWKSRIVLG